MPIIRANGADFDVEQVGRGGDVVLLHSLLTDRLAFEPIVPALARRRRLTLVNLPGFGGSTPAGPAIEDYAERVADLLAVLGGRPDVIANGLGGFVATALAARHGERLGRLVLADTAATFPEPAKTPLRVMAERVLSDGMGAVVDLAVKRIFPEAYIAAHPEAVDARRAVLLRASPAHFATACRALAAVDLRPALPRIANPALVVVGTLDAATPPDLARDLAAGLHRATLVEIPDCGHCPPLEKPAAFLDAVRGFLALE